MPLPRSGLLSLWLVATLHGRIGPDEFADAVRADDPQHLIAGWPGRDEPTPLAELPALVRRLAPAAVLLAMPVPGDPLGLAGPAGFNADVLEAGDAVLLAGAPGSPALGLIPQLDARTVVWKAHEALSPAVSDPGEAARTLRATLVSATAELARLDVASWQPEIPDLLLNLRHRPPLPLPPGTAAETIDALERADLCRDIAALALGDDGGAVSAHEIHLRRRCLTDLDHAARRAFTACCSDSLGST